jgi:hypothetical protein
LLNPEEGRKQLTGKGLIHWNYQRDNNKGAFVEAPYLIVIIVIILSM